MKVWMIIKIIYIFILTDEFRRERRNSIQYNGNLIAILTRLPGLIVACNYRPKKTSNLL